MLTTLSPLIRRLPGWAAICLLTACVEVTPQALPQPVLITLPASTPQVTEDAGQTPTPTGSVPGTQIAPPTPAPGGQGLPSARQLWEWDQVARPQALAATPGRAVVIIADGRFAWLNIETGRIESAAYLWSGLLQGDSWGEVYTDGIVAIAAVREQSINPETGLADSRARLVAYDAQANELWALRQMESQHFYSAALASGPGLVFVGKWPGGFADNSLAAHELFTGQQLWAVREGDSGFQQIIHDGTRLYALLNDSDGGGVGCYDLRTGERLWTWRDPAVPQPDLIALGNGALYVLSAEQVVSLDSTLGAFRWAAHLSAAAEAGLVTDGQLVYLAPAPSAQTGFRPGLLALDASTGELAWPALGGLLADPLALGVDALWAIVKDYDAGIVYLSGLEPGTGLEQVRLPVGHRPAEVIYQLVALDRRVYVLGETLAAYGY